MTRCRTANAATALPVIDTTTAVVAEPLLEHCLRELIKLSRVATDESTMARPTRLHLVRRTHRCPLRHESGDSPAPVISASTDGVGFERRLRRCTTPEGDEPLQNPTRLAPRRKWRDPRRWSVHRGFERGESSPTGTSGTGNTACVLKLGTVVVGADDVERAVTFWANVSTTRLSRFRKPATTSRS